MEPGICGEARLELVWADSLLLWRLLEALAERVPVLLVLDSTERDGSRLFSWFWLQIISVDIQEKEVYLLAIKFF